MHNIKDQYGKSGYQYCKDTIRYADNSKASTKIQ